MKAPPSKSAAHRALICGALAGGSRIENIDRSDDIQATERCLVALGAGLQDMGDAAIFGDFSFSDGTEVLDCGESGSTLRFLIPLCLVTGNEYVLQGSDRLMCRPMGVYEDLCKERGLLFVKSGNRIRVKGPLNSGFYRVPGDISSQFISGLLFALPLLEGNSRIEIVRNLESRSYIDLTLQMMGYFGIRWERPAPEIILIPGGQKYSGRTIQVEGGYSNAAFFQAFNILGGKVGLTGLDAASLQGDRVSEAMLSAIAGGTPCLDLSDCPDLAPILFAVAAAKTGACFTGTERLRLKESDRVEAMQEELAKFGVLLETKCNSVTVTGSGLKRPRDVLWGHNDHRVIMALSVLCTVTGGVIEGAEAVRKSLPDFFERLCSLGIQVRKEEQP